MRCGIRRLWLAAALLGGLPGALATDWYVDSSTGDDARVGRSPGGAWRTLKRAASTEVKPGDRVLLRAGSVWKEPLIWSERSGAEGRPIVIDRYGDGPVRPRIEAEGKAEDAILIRNSQWVEVRNLEVTNRGAEPGVRRGVHIYLNNFGTARHIVVSGLYIHDVNGTNQKKDNGGIIFRTSGARTPSRFDGLTIERNIVWKVDRSAIAAQSFHWSRNHWFPSLNVVIRDNYVDDIGGDGIVPWATDGALVEHNIAKNCNMRAGSYNAGIWPWSTDNSVFRLNEAAYTRTTLDGQGFDSDYNSRNTLLEYNYSHENEGGFLLICSPGNRKAEENLGNYGTIVRRNLSWNDKSRIFNISQVNDTQIEDNVAYVGAGLDVQVVLFSNWSGWAENTVFARNRFVAEGTARYGHASAGNKDGTYALSAGWGPAKGTSFQGNEFAGNQVDRPEDSTGNVRETASIPARDWKGPAFDPAKPANFGEYLDAHRKWMRELLSAEVGGAPPR